MPNLAIVFDFDGVILDTETPLYSSWQEMYSRYGVHLDLELFATYIGGAEYFDFHTHLQEQTGLSLDRESLMEERRALYQQHVAGNTVLPGVKDYLREARCLGYGIGLASNSDIGWVGSNLRELGLFDEFDVLKTRDDVVNVKPDPEIYLAALHDLKTEPHHAIAIEDSASGVAAAKAAGLFTVAVPNPITKYHNLAKADLTLDSLASTPFRELAKLASTRPLREVQDSDLPPVIPANAGIHRQATTVRGSDKTTAD